MKNGQFNSVFRDDIFKGQRILITGGGTGIGRCIAHELASLGAEVILAGRRIDPLTSTVGEIQEAGGRAYAYPLNIRDEKAVDETIKRMCQDVGPLTGLVNNAGGQFASPAFQIPPKGWRAVVDTNLNGTFLVTLAAFKHAMAHTGGAIVNIVADIWNGFPGMAHTGAARAGVVNMTKTLAVEWASSGVRINAVAPGIILSSGMKNYPTEILDMAEGMFFENPTGRPGSESEVSSAVTFLLSPAAAYINGATLRVDGAASLQKTAFFPPSKHDALPPWEGFHLEADLPERFQKKDSDPDG